MAELAGLFLFIGLTSFGGGITAYIRRIVVTQRKWLTDEEKAAVVARIEAEDWALSNSFREPMSWDSPSTSAITSRDLSAPWWHSGRC